MQYPINTISAGNFLAIDLVLPVETPTLAEEVRVGAAVKAVYVEVWLQGATSQVGSCTVIIEKLSSGSAGIGFTGLADLHNYANKKNILFTGEGLLGDANTNPVPVHRGWLKIPKGKQRFGLGDKLQLAVSSQADDTFICGMTIFKEYF